MEYILNELELMALGATTDYQNDTRDLDMVEKWQKLFGYAPPEAASKIEQHRNDLNRTVITLAHWGMVRDEKEAEGYDKESYEHSIDILKHDQSPSPTYTAANVSNKTKAAMFLLKLEGPLMDVKMVQEAAKLAQPPELLMGHGDSGCQTQFYKIDSLARDNILDFSGQQAPPFAPTIISYCIADKDLCPISAHPTLGIEATLPQFRHDSNATPQNDEYPVWYFFYGTLADNDVLGGLVGVRRPHLVPAQTRGGVLKTWGGKYKALVDQMTTGSVGIIDGHAFLVETYEQETALRAYETDNYEVVRCGIEMKGERYVNGLTFRFVGEVD
ncbi:hypothetical protein BKA67DRAFT_654409 [Truncatella angustata]|uniref:Gamma-glutamylcyclotransferase AIG2-like domain-containing protein n=1 Tax=Truncatella angustata TaxID=152316 RepID=A0A9P8UZ73_9PEZI|nr:uncharacterized protein BKA67DRAFT_654409 [Truncatella angustata]KAH6661286.1 hypothetical protein BKA67DRAFT_654409 [Truncatella angustata]